MGARMRKSRTGSVRGPENEFSSAISAEAFDEAVRSVEFSVRAQPIFRRSRESLCCDDRLFTVRKRLGQKEAVNAVLPR